jgi:hypothetical protein
VPRSRSRSSSGLVAGLWLMVGLPGNSGPAVTARIRGNAGCSAHVPDRAASFEVSLVRVFRVIRVVPVAGPGEGEHQHRRADADRARCVRGLQPAASLSPPGSGASGKALSRRRRAQGPTTGGTQARRARTGSPRGALAIPPGQGFRAAGPRTAGTAPGRRRPAWAVPRAAGLDRHGSAAPRAPAIRYGVPRCRPGTVAGCGPCVASASGRGGRRVTNPTGRAAPRSLVPSRLPWCRDGGKASVPDVDCVRAGAGDTLSRVADLGQPR